MKKILLPLLSLAALAACTKSEVQYEAPGAITFSPVAQNITKSVAGYDYDEESNKFDGSLPTGVDLYVFANAQNDYLSETWPDTYFKNAQFVYQREGTSNAVYEGATPYYWPNVKSLIFAGYTDAGNISELVKGENKPTMDFATNILAITGYIQDNSNNSSEAANDLMWFPYDGKSYTKSVEHVDVTLQHACSWITVQVIGDATTGNNYLLKGLTVNGLHHKGNVECKATTAEGKTTYAATWTCDEDTSNEVLYSSESGEQFPSDNPKVFENVSQNFIVLPQTPTTIDVTYSYVPQTDVSPITETVKGLSLKYNGDATWQSGVHYIYTITIRATEILIDPLVTEWDVYDGDADKDGDQPVEVPSI